MRTINPMIIGAIIESMADETGPAVSLAFAGFTVIYEK